MNATPPFTGTGPQGHRGRMRTRLLAAGAAGLADYELLEMLLFFSIPRRDTKPLAKAAINHCGDLQRTLTASPDTLRSAGLDRASANVMGFVRESARRLAVASTMPRPALSDMAQLTGYLDPAARRRRPPHCAVLFLTSRNQLLAEAVFTAEQDAVAITQAVARQALRVQASALILASFRPGSNDPRPDERALTRSIGAMADALSLTLHDHLLFGSAGHASVKQPAGRGR